MVVNGWYEGAFLGYEEVLNLHKEFLFNKLISRFRGV